MASWLPSFDFSFSLGRNVLVGVSIGLGIGIGIGAGMAASRKMFALQAQDQKLVVRFTELTNEIKELRCVMIRLEVCLNETKTIRTVPLRNQASVLGSDVETEDEFYEMSEDETSPRFVVCLFSLLNFAILGCKHSQALQRVPSSFEVSFVANEKSCFLTLLLEG